MTREEAIERMKIIKGDCYIIDNPKDKEAFDMSIFALEQEPYELLIIKSDILQHQEDRKKWIESIKREKENGVIILPPYFTPLLVPNDVEIRIEQPCDDAISRILKKMWNCRGKHTTSIDKVKMEQIIRDELPSVTQKSGKWIPVSERLPEDIKPVIITWKNTDPKSYYQYIVGKHYIGTAHYKGGKWFWYSSVTEDLLAEYGRCDSEEFDEAIEVIAWMPLPEPYKAESEE